MYTCLEAWAKFKKILEKKKINKIIFINKKSCFIYFILGPVAVPKGIIVNAFDYFVLLNILMAVILTSLQNTIIAGVVLAILLFVIFLNMDGSADYAFWTFFIRWLHVISGVMWIGILWYFNSFKTSM